MHARRRRLGIVAAVLATAALVALPVSPAGAGPVPDSESCTAGGIIWRADITRWEDSGLGPLVKVDGLFRFENGAWHDASNEIWRYRWDNSPEQWSPATHPLNVTPFKEIEGALSAFGGQYESYLESLLLVVPSGLCQIYLSPFSNLGSSPTWPEVGFLGDSLMAQLNHSGYNVDHVQGYIEGHVKATLSTRAEVDGHGGRRLTEDPDPALSSLATANSSLIDEFRGLVQYGADGVVVGLGANDALSYWWGSYPSTPQARWDYVMARMPELVAEMRAATPCLVWVTTPEQETFNAHYDVLTKQFNDVLRLLAAQFPNDSLHLIDFAALAESHDFGGPDPWFISDKIHLNDAGKLVYTDVMRIAADFCV